VEIEGILAIIFVLGIPSMALATHLVIRPILRDLAKLKGDKASRDQLEGRIAQIEDVVRDLDREVGRLVEAEHFRRELETGKGPRSLPES
jgi:hypothetical protein